MVGRGSGCTSQGGGLSLYKTKHDAGADKRLRASTIEGRKEEEEKEGKTS